MGVITQTITRNPLAEYGYTPLTTFWEDFSLADHFGITAITDTYERAFREWKGDYQMMTELVMVLNHKIWQHYQKNEAIALTYNRLWEKLSNWCMDTFTGEQLDYYMTTTD